MPTTQWNDLVAMALIGTQRRVPQFSSSDDSLGYMFEQLSSVEPERALLVASAAAALYARGGRAPAMDERTLPTPCDLDDWPRCSPRSGAHLSRMLEREYDYGQLLPEWMRASIKAQKRVPEELLPSLLDMGLRHKEWRAQIVEVIGNRGRWLAAQNAAWEYAAGIDSEDDWATGNTSARKWLLKKLRAAKPTQASELLASTWAEEIADNRVEFLGAFYTGLSQEDEPFLETALDDRSTKVRHQAAQLLMRIPSSALSQRMIERARPLLKLKRGKKARLEVMLPDVCDETMIRDGIAPEPPMGGIGARAYWLSGIMAAIPPSQWLEDSSLTAAELVDLTGKDEWKDVLPEALALAAYRHAVAEVAEALLVADFNHYMLTEQLMQVLPPERREALILDTLKKDKSLLHPAHPAMKYLDNLKVADHVCSPALSRTVLAALRRTLDKGGVAATELASTFYWLGLRLNQGVAQEVAVVLSLKDKVAPAGWEAEVKKMVSQLEFRQSMLKELMG
jgi:hypothetical protein